MGPLEKQVFCDSLEFYHLMGNRLANGHPCHWVERSFPKLKPMREMEKLRGRERDRGVRGVCVCACVVWVEHDTV